MSTGTPSLPEALARTLPLLDRPPVEPDAGPGYLDLLGRQPDEPSGAVQALWSSTVGSAFYDHGQALARLLVAAARPPASVLRVPPGGRALDVGCGPGGVTGTLGRAAGVEGLALGVDVSRPMLARAVRAHARRNVGFVRADARHLPFRDATFDAVTCLAVLQLIPEPFSVLTQIARVLAPGGRVAVMVPTVHGALLHRLSRLIGYSGGLRFFDPAEIAANLRTGGLRTVHTRRTGTIVVVTASKPASKPAGRPASKPGSKP